MKIMGIPLTYNLRNLMVRRTTTVMTALGMALTVVVLLAALALVDGLRAAFRSSGDARNVLVLRKGSSSELSSAISQETYHDMLYTPGVAENGGNPMASLELITVVTLPKPGNLDGQAVTLRGLLPIGIELRRLRLKEGRWFHPPPRSEIGSVLAVPSGKWWASWTLGVRR
jgi:putative ABC transport system permease protein